MFLDKYQKPCSIIKHKLLLPPQPALSELTKQYQIFTESKMHDLKAQKWLAKHNCVKQDLSLQTETGIDVVIISRESKNKNVNLEKL